MARIRPLESKISKTSTLITSTLLTPAEEKKKKKFYHRIQLEIKENFSYALFQPEEEVWEKPPQGILAFDLDKTLIDPIHGGVLDSNIKDIIQVAKNANYLIVCVTARLEENQLSDNPFSALSLIKKISKENFSMVFFTNGRSKIPALEYLYTKSGLPKSSICLLDDLPAHIVASKNKGFAVIPVVEDFKGSYLDFIEKFIKGELLTDKKYKEYLQKYLEDPDELKPRELSDIEISLEDGLPITFEVNYPSGTFKA